MNRWWCVAILSVGLLATETHAQEFAIPDASGARTPGALLDRGLPQGGAAFAAALDTRWPLDLSARSLMIGGAWRGVAAAAGVSRAGDGELGWSAAGLALGFADRGAGAGLRGVLRHDDGASEFEPHLGVEVGAGGWVRFRFGRVWATVPQAWQSGVSPPLPRGLTLGAELESSGVLFALEREAPRRGLAESAGHTARLAVVWSSVAAWLEARDDPWRGGIGISATAGALHVAAQVDSHPVLAPTVRLSAGVELRARRS